MLALSLSLWSYRRKRKKNVFVKRGLSIETTKEAKTRRHFSIYAYEGVVCPRGATANSAAHKQAEAPFTFSGARLVCVCVCVVCAFIFLDTFFLSSSLPHCYSISNISAPPSTFWSIPFPPLASRWMLMYYLYLPFIYYTNYSSTKLLYYSLSQHNHIHDDLFALVFFTFESFRI